MKTWKINFICRPSKKTLLDLYKRLILKIIEDLGEIISASGKADEIVEVDSLLGGIILEVDEMAKAHRVENETVQARK